MNYLFIALLVYLAAVAFLYFYQRNLMYFPDTSRPKPSVAGVFDIELAEVATVDGLELEGWYFPPRDGQAIIVYFHGNADNLGGRVPKIEVYLERGYGVLLAGYRGYGGNPGSPSEEGLYKDARAYIDWLVQNKSTRPEDMILYGESLGSGVAVQMATEYNVKAIVLEAPFSAATAVAKKTYFYVPVDLLMRDQYRNIDKIGDIDVPLLFIHGSRDNVTPVEIGRRLFEAANEPKTFVELPNAMHNDVYDHGAALHVLKFLSTIAELSAPEAESKNQKE